MRTGRSGGARGLAIGVAMAVAMAGCGETGAGPSGTSLSSPMPPTSAVPTAPAVASRVADSPAPTATSGVELQPQAVIEIPNLPGVIQVAVDGRPDARGAVWTSGDLAAWRIDPATNETTSIPILIGPSDWTGIAIAEGDLWATDVHGGHVLRVDPATGRQIAVVEAARPTLLTPTDGGIWFARETGGSVARIDPDTNTIGTEIEPAIGLGGAGPDAWFSRDTSTTRGREAVRADAATGRERASYSIPDGTGCSFLDDGRGAVWTWCTPNPHVTTVAVIDLATGAVPSFSSDRSYIGGLVEIGDRTWALVGATPDEHAALIELGPQGPTGVGATLPAGLDPDWSVVSAGSLWVPSDGRGQVWRFDLAAIEALR